MTPSTHKASLTVNGGFILASGARAAERSELRRNFQNQRGQLLATGGKNTNPSSTSSQNTIIFNGLGNSGDYVHLQTAEGSPVMTYQFPRSYMVLKLMYSASDLTKGKGYSLYMGGEVTEGENVHGFILGGNYTPGTLLKNFNITYTVTTVN
jgi:hypothetical protein